MSAPAHKASRSFARSFSEPYVASLIIFPLVAFLALDNKFDFVDDSYYVLLAKSLAGGFGYSDISQPAPHFYNHFPPGLPLLLSIPTLFGFDLSTNVILYKLVLIACGAASLYLFSRLAVAKGFSREAVSAVILLASVSIVFVGFTTRVASEMLYSLLAVAALLALTKYERGSSISRWLLVSALLLVACLLTRSIGVVLIGAAFLTLTLKRDFKRAILIVITAGLVWLPWFVVSRGEGSAIGTYYREFLSTSGNESIATIAKRMLYNGWLILDRDIPRVIFSISSSEFIRGSRSLNATFLPVRLGISALVVLPILNSVRRKPCTAAVYVLGYLVLISMWPGDPSRYIVPMVPFFCLGFIEGLRKLFEKVSTWNPGLPNLQRSAFISILLLCVATQLITDARVISVVRRSGHYSFEAASIWNETMTAYGWVKQNTAPSSVIGCDLPIAANIYLFTERKAVSLPKRPEAYAQRGITHIAYIIDPTLYEGPETKEKPNLEQFISRTSGKLSLKLVYQSPNVSIFELE
jgi:4-amino-4-deoxy-L-arabinose transferase-like glycosyltransferase